MADEDYDKAVTTESEAWRVMQLVTKSRIASRKKARKFPELREHAGFAEVVSILENAQVAEEGFEPPTRGL